MKVMSLSLMIDEKGIKMVRPGDVIQTSLPVHGNWSLKGVAAVCWFVVPQRMSCEGHHTPSFCG